MKKVFKLSDPFIRTDENKFICEDMREHVCSKRCKKSNEVKQYVSEIVKPYLVSEKKPSIEQRISNATGVKEIEVHLVTQYIMKNKIDLTNDN